MFTRKFLEQPLSSPRHCLPDGELYLKNAGSDLECYRTSIIGSTSRASYLALTSSLFLALFSSHYIQFYHGPINADIPTVGC